MANEYELPEDLLLAQQQLNRQQKMAEMLMQQNQQPQGQMISGRYVAPSFFQQLAPVANMLTGAYLAKKGDTESAKLAQKIREGKASAEEKIINDITGYDKTTELAGPYTGNVPMPTAVQRVEPNLNEALRKIRTNEFGVGKEYIPSILKQIMPEPTELERNFKAAQKQGYTGTITDYKNMMTDAQREENRIARARLGLQAQEQAWNMGLPVGGVGGGGAVAPQAPLRTINPGSPILVPNQAPQGAMPQVGMPQGQMPRFNSKIEQDLWLANAKERGKLQTEAMAALPSAELKVQTALGAINNMIGDTTLDEKGNIKLGQKKPHAGFYEAVGMPSVTNAFGLTGLFPGSDVQDFKTEFNKVGGSAFLQAVETLRGTGAISEVEGKKATDAITSMSLAQSEKAFIKAANEFRDAIQKGYVASQQKAGVLPFTPNQQLTTGTQPKLRWNPQTGTFE